MKLVHDNGPHARTFHVQNCWFAHETVWYEMCVFLIKTLITDMVEDLSLQMTQIFTSSSETSDCVCALVFNYCMLMTKTCLKKCISNSSLSYKRFLSDILYIDILISLVQKFRGPFFLFICSNSFDFFFLVPQTDFSFVLTLTRVLCFWLTSMHCI